MVGDSIDEEGFTCSYCCALLNACEIFQHFNLMAPTWLFSVSDGSVHSEISAFQANHFGATVF